MNNKVEELFEIIKNGAEITLSHDDEQFIDEALKEASKVAAKFSKKDWENLITKFPFDTKGSRDYNKIKESSLRAIIEDEDSSAALLINYSILEIIIKNAPNSIKISTIENLYKHSKNNKAEISKSKTCGCFYCEKIFAPKEIKNWLEKEKTALCPYCSVDSVLGDASGVQITSNLLKEMHKIYF